MDTRAPAEAMEKDGVCPTNSSITSTCRGSKALPAALASASVQSIREAFPDYRGEILWLVGDSVGMLQQLGVFG